MTTENPGGSLSESPAKLTDEGKRLLDQLVAAAIAFTVVAETGRVPLTEHERGWYETELARLRSTSLTPEDARHILESSTELCGSTLTKLSRIANDRR